MPAASSAAAASAASGSSSSGRRPPPDAFLCPISQELMAEPVMAADGHSYEKAEIEKWFATGKQTSPMTNSAMASRALTPNHTLKSQIREWQERSNAQCIADLIATVVLADDPKEVERQLGALALFVGHNKAVVQPQTLQKLSQMLVGASSPVQQCLRAVDAECRLVAAGFAARLRDEQRDQGLAAAALAVSKSKLAQLDRETVAAEEALSKLKEKRAKQGERVLALVRMEQDCASRAAQVEQELGGYPEPLGLLEEADDDDEAGRTGGESDCREAGQEKQGKRKRTGGGEQGTAVAKRQRGGSSSAVVDCETLLREGLEWFQGDNFRVEDEMRGQLLVETAAAREMPLAIAQCKCRGWGGYSGGKDDTTAAFGEFRDIVEGATEGTTWVLAEAQRMLGELYEDGHGGVDKDEAEAVKWYRKAVEQGTRPAIRVLARNYRRGIGVEKDEAEASRWQQQLE
jgi:hypothetical protein